MNLPIRSRPVNLIVMPRLPIQRAPLRRRAKQSPLEFTSALIDRNLLAYPTLASTCKLLALIAITSICYGLGSQYQDSQQYIHLMPLVTASCRGGV